MKKFSTKRAAALGMTSALALGTVVSAGVMAPADADAAGTTYTCTLTAPIGDQPMTVSGSLGLPTTVQSGQSLANLPVSMNVVMPQTLVPTLITVLSGLGLGTPSAVGGTVTGMSFPVTGSTALPIGKLTAPQAKPSSTDGTLTIAGVGKTATKRAPLPGDYPVVMPKDFSFTPVVTFPAGDVTLPTPVPCHSDSPATLGTMHVVKATSATSAKLVNAPVTTAKRGKIATVVRAAGYAAKGKVAAFEGTKQLGKSVALSSGKATIVLPLLKKGAHTIKVKYLGNAGTKSSSKSLSFTVKRG